MKRVARLERNIHKGPLAEVQLSDDLPPNVVKDIEEILDLNRDNYYDEDAGIHFFHKLAPKT